MLKKVLEVGGYATMVLTNLLLSPLSRKTAYWLAEYGMLLGYFFCRKSRHNVLANIEYILQLSGDRGEGHEFRKKVRRKAKEVFINFGKQFYDMMLMTRYNRAALEEVFDFHNADRFAELLERGKGAIGITAHFSSWELCATMLAMQFGRISGVFLSHSNKGVNNFYIRQRASRNIRTIMPGNHSFHQCLEALRRNEILAIVGDIDYAGNGVEVEFLKKRFRVPKGPPLVALRSGSPMICAAFLRKGPSRIDLQFGEVVDPPEELDTDAKARYITDRYLRYFEGIILQDPSQWIMFHKLADLPSAGDKA
jgi:KDO2-lipid IV(A) lauroyltransferase